MKLRTDHISFFALASRNLIDSFIASLLQLHRFFWCSILVSTLTFISNYLFPFTPLSLIYLFHSVTENGFLEHFLQAEVLFIFYIFIMRGKHNPTSHNEVFRPREVSDL